jgi:hypothetical protein
MEKSDDRDIGQRIRDRIRLINPDLKPHYSGNKRRQNQATGMANDVPNIGHCLGMHVGKKQAGEYLVSGSNRAIPAPERIDQIVSRVVVAEDGESGVAGARERRSAQLMGFVEQLLRFKAVAERD